MTKTIAIGTLALTVVTHGLGVSAQEMGDAGRGRRYAQTVCAECHAVTASQMVSPNPAVAPFRMIANTPGMTALALTVWFRTPHPTMPSFVLTQQDTDDVIAYILSLKDK
jgi:mono/diheme cytochrome c family protein